MLEVSALKVGQMVFPVGPDETERMHALLQMGLIDGQQDSRLDALCADARARFDVSIALVTLLSASQQVFQGRCGIEQSETPRSVAFCNYTILGDEVFVVEDAQTDARFATNSLVTGPPFIRFYAGAPLIYLRNIRLGAFCLLDSRPRTFSLGEREELQLFAESAISILVNRAFPELPSLLAP
jgi:GAF domain-containing protein